MFSGLLLALTLAIAPGETAPELQLPSLDGGTLRRADLVGKVTVVEFFALGCGACKAGLRDLKALRAALGNRVRVVVIAIGDPDDKLRRYLAGRLPDGALVGLDRNGAAARRWGETRLPATYFLDALGVVRQVDRTHGPGFRARARGWLQALLAGR